LGSIFGAKKGSREVPWQAKKVPEKYPEQITRPNCIGIAADYEGGIAPMKETIRYERND
jgi:hypothetical protein